jgi:dihydropteroate synthase
MLLIDKPKIMGIVNLTPDSFYVGSRFNDNSSILRVVAKMINDGADIIDIGGQSTRPGSERISQDEELKRVLPALELLCKEYPEIVISIDTFYAKVATEAIETGACIVNDISAGRFDSNMLAVVGKLEVPYVCMHALGTPDIMQQKPIYENVTREVLDFLIEKLEVCRLSGIKDIIMDPGFGFGKTIRHNFELLKNLSVFRMLDKPILFGISRKSTISKTLNTTAEYALNGTTSLNTIALMNGADILRVHDVTEAKEVVLLYQEYNS